jgi:hypothetical protein
MTARRARRRFRAGEGDVLPGTYIRFYCVAHKPSATVRSPLTIYDRAWAYCPGDETGEHTWSAIEPTSYAEIRGKTPQTVTTEAKTTA